MKFFQSLNEQLPLYFATVALVPLLVFGFSMSFLLERNISEAALHDLDVHTDEIAQGVSTTFQTVVRELELLSVSLDLGLIEQPNQVDLLLKTVLGRSGELTSLLLLDRQHRVVHLALPEHLEFQKQDYLGFDYSGHEFFKGGKPPDKLLWSATFPSLLTGEPSVSLKIPMANGSLLANLSFGEIKAFAKHAQHYQGSVEIAIVDRNGVLIKHSRAELAKQRLSCMECPAVVRAIKEGVSTPAHLHKETNLLECVQIIPETDWVVRVALPASDALSQVFRIRWLLLGASSGAVCLGLLFTLWFTARFVKPITLLMEKTGEIAAGRYDLNMPPSRYRELNHFAEQFQRMGTAVKQRELQLYEAQTLLSDLVNSVDGVVWEMNLDEQKYTFISQQAEKMFGYPQGRWMQEQDFWQQCIHPDDRDLVVFRRLKHVTEGLDHEEEYRIVTASDKIVWVRELINVSLYDDQTRVLRGILIDISSQRYAAEALQAEEEKSRLLTRQLQALLETIPYRIDLRDRTFEILWSNNQQIDQESRKLLPPCAFRCTSTEHATYDFCPECPTSRCFVSAKREEGMITGRENTTWYVRAFPIIDEDGQFNQVIQMIENVTERLKKEQLEARTGQLAALGELAAGVAHEINNPINGIINYAQLILNRAEVGTREAEISQRIIKEGDRVASIVRELLHFSREESTETHVVAIRSVLDEVISLIGAQLRKENVHLDITLPEDLPCIESRSHQIEQTFLNIISNALHALGEKYEGPDPGKTLEIRAERVVVDDQSMARVLFRDYGNGIPAELLKRVLNPFVTTKPAGVGTGLGLSITHEILKKHGGTIQIDSQVGEYTLVTVDLPAIE